VFRGYFKDNLTKIVAVKQIPLQNVSKDPKFIKLLKREIEILMKVKSNYIVALYHATRTPNNLYMFLEYCGDGDLKELLKRRGGKITESEAVLYFRQITEGFKALFEESIIHRDIKPANILLKDGMAKISDFGFAKCLDGVGMDEATKNTYLGTPLYMAPQLLVEDKFSSKCDIWSLGMMFYEMLYGHTPWTGKTPYQLWKNI
jgi:serine/threonine-protein kinase ULK/ATG1